MPNISSRTILRFSSSPGSTKQSKLFKVCPSLLLLIFSFLFRISEEFSDSRSRLSSRKVSDKVKLNGGISEPRMGKFSAIPFAYSTSLLISSISAIILLKLLFFSDWFFPPVFCFSTEPLNSRETESSATSAFYLF